MNKRFRAFIIIYFLLALLPFGCSSVQVSQDYRPGSNFTHLKTYSWKYKNQEKKGDMRIDSALMDERIRKATDNMLSKKGYTNVNKGAPDFYITYDYSISRKVYSTPVNMGMGVGHGRYGRYGALGIRTGTEINEYNEGLLIVDFLKPDSDTVLWRGMSTRVVMTHSTPEKATQDIDETIKAMLSQFPPDQ